MVGSNSGGEYTSDNSLLALWLEVVDKAKWYILLFDQRNGIAGWCLWNRSYMMNDSHGLEWIAGLRTCICSGGAWMDWYNLAYTKGSPFRDFSRYSGRVIWWIMFLLYRSGSYSGGACSYGEHNPLPLMSKGENELKILRLPSSPKGEIVGIMILVWLYDTYIVLDGNPLILCREKVHALSCREKFISCREKFISCREKVHALSCWRTYLWSMVVSPWYLNLWFWTMVPR